MKYHTFLFVKLSLLEKLAAILAQSSGTLSLTVQIKISLTKSKPDTVALHTMSKIVFVDCKHNSHACISKMRHVIRMRNRLLFRRHYGSENNQIKHLLVNALLAISRPPINTVFNYTKCT